MTALGKPGNREDLQRCKDFCAGFLAHLDAKYSPAPQPAVAVITPGEQVAEAEARLSRRGLKITESRLKRELQNIKIESMMPTHSLEKIAGAVGLPLDTLRTRIKKLKN